MTRGRPPLRSVMVLLAAVLLPLAWFASAKAQPRKSVVHLLEIEGVVSPMAARYLDRGLEDAASAGAEAVVVRLDTPGGTMSAMQEMVESLLGARVPVVVHVAPAGARAASAGVFITAAAHIAAMAPGTRLGAAHPVSLGGGRASGDDAMEGKVVNDAAALVRAIAERRGRNAEWLERAVRESVSATAEEARELGVVDLVVEGPEPLLAALNGRTIETAAGGPRTLHLADAVVEASPMNLAERVLHTITDPNVAYLLFSLGLLGLAVELSHPGLIVPGVVGGISVILALVAFGSLPVNWGGVALIAVGIALVVVDALTAGHGLLAVGGVVSLIVGGLFFYRPLGPITPAMPDLSLSPWSLGATVAVVGGFSLIVLRALWRVRGTPVQSGPQALIGRTGVALSELAQEGRVRVDSETWTAVAEGEDVAAGETIRVLGIEGVTLRVRREGTT